MVRNVRSSHMLMEGQTRRTAMWRCVFARATRPAAVHHDARLNLPHEIGDHGAADGEGAEESDAAECRRLQARAEEGAEEGVARVRHCGVIARRRVLAKAGRA